MARIINQMTDELRQSITMGKKALERHEIKKAFDALIIPSNFDSRAKSLLLKLVGHYHRMRLITAEQIERNQVEQYAEKGYPMSQYVLGRYHQMVKPDKDSIEKAKKWYDAARKSGIVDAAACEALMVLDGYYGPVDMVQYRSLIQEGLEQDSTKDYCSYALQRTLIEQIDGLYCAAPNPQYVVDTIKAIIGQDESDDVDEVDPVYYKCLGMAYDALGEKEKAKHYFLKAIDMGYSECCTNYAFVMPPNQTFSHKAWQHWEEINMMGCKCGDPGSFVLASICFETHYDDLPDEEKQKRTTQIKDTLTRAYALGDEYAATLMGYNYYYGENGFDENHVEAWRWFNNGAYWEDGTGFAMAALMISEGQSPEPFGQEVTDYWYLQALRRGDENELERVVETYCNGGLTQFAKEIETSYIPRYKAQSMENSEDEDDYPDDNGRWDAWS